MKVILFCRNKLSRVVSIAIFAVALNLASIKYSLYHSLSDIDKADLNWFAG